MLNSVKTHVRKPFFVGFVVDEIFYIFGFEYCVFSIQRLADV